MKKATSILTLISGVVLFAAGLLGLLQSCMERPEDGK